jgi:TorA maturation chaperone TorD
MRAVDHGAGTVSSQGGSGKDAEVRATMYTFLARMFNERPDQALVRRLRSLGSEWIAELAQSIDLPDEAVRGLKDIARFVEASAEAPEDDIAQSLAVDWTRLFRGVAPGYGPPPPYEGVYMPGNVEASAVLQAVVTDYLKHDVVMFQDSVNRPDYIGLEFDFLALLAEREQAAWESGDTAAAVGKRSGAQEFFDQHAGRWVKLYCDKAIEQAKTDFYRGLLLLTRGVVEELTHNGENTGARNPQ